VRRLYALEETCDTSPCAYVARIERQVRKGRHDFYRLKFGKGDSLALLPMLYRDPGWPALQRKRRKWTSYIGTLRM